MTKTKTFVIITKKVGHNPDDWYQAMDALSDILYKYSEHTQNIVSNATSNVVRIRFTPEDQKMQSMMSELRKLRSRYNVQIHLYEASFSWSLQ